MNEIMEATEQTPIEIALGIDADGMTTARKLYAFLELAPQHFARWCKKNITENDFATENEDYTRLTTNGETPTGGKVEREDYRLTAQFAKKLSMMSKSERGEQARDYFTSVEDKAKEMIVAMREASKDPMKMLKLHY